MFNGWKHHAGFLCFMIQTWAQRPEDRFPLLAAKLKMLGESLFDMYTGPLEPSEIANELIRILQAYNAYNRDDYFRWIDSSPQSFWQISISDGSDWTLRKNENPSEYYIHIHPSRYSKNSRRIKANQLRTALATLIMASMRDQQPDIALMNRVRNDFLGLSKVSGPQAKEIFVSINELSQMSGLKFHKTDQELK